MATSSSRAMQSSLVVLLLLSAVVASQAHQVSCKNSCEKAMFFNGVCTDVGETTVLEVKNVIVVEVDEGEGVKHVVQFKCPEHVQALEFVSRGGGFVKAQITDVDGLRPTLHSGRRSLRESDRSLGRLDLVSKHRGLQAGGGLGGGLYTLNSGLTSGHTSSLTSGLTSRLPGDLNSLHDGLNTLNTGLNGGLTGNVGGHNPP